MRNAVDNILRPLLPKHGDEINILYFPYDGIFEQSLISRKYRYFTMIEHQIHPSSPKIYPENFNLLNQGMLSYITKLDLVVANHRKSQLQIAQSFADRFHLPLVLIDHELPASDASDKLRIFVNKQYEKGQGNISFDPLLAEEWRCSLACHGNYGGNIFSSSPMFELKDNDVCFIGDHVAEDSLSIARIINSHPKIKAVGHNYGVTPEYKDFTDIMGMMYSSKIGIQVISEPRPPLLALYQMCLGCIPIINETRWTKRWFNEDVCVLYDIMESIPTIIDDLLHDEHAMKEMGKAGAEFVKEKFNIQNFNDFYNPFIEQESKKMYTRK